MVKKAEEMNISNPTFLCPACGLPMRIVFSGVLIEPQKDRVPAVDSEMIRALFHKSIRDDLDIEVDGKIARITIKGKFSRSKFKKVSTQVAVYAGRWIKGYFWMPIAGIYTREEIKGDRDNGS